MTDEYLVDRITKLEQENEKLSKECGRWKKQWIWREFLGLVVLFGLLGGCVFSPIVAFCVGVEKGRYDKCAQWCSANKSKYNSPIEYMACFEECDEDRSCE